MDDNGKKPPGQGALSYFVGRESGTVAVCTSEAYRFLFMDYSTVVKPYPCRTGEKEKRPMTILAFTGLVLSYGNALFSLLFLVWFIFALMDGRKVGIR